MSKHRLSRAAIGLALLAVSALALAEGELPLGSWTPPKPLARANPPYPVAAAQQWKEGWVLVSFCIDVNGDVQTPVIERSSGAAMFERATLRAVEQWKYEPARLDGSPIEQCRVNVRLSFFMEGIGLGARPEFVRKWKKASALIEEAKLAEAKAILDELTPYNNYESARLALARSRIALNTGDQKQQLADLRMALLQPKSLEKSLRRDVRRKVFALEVQQQQWAAAYETYEDLADQVEKLSEPERKVGAQLTSLVTGDQALATDGELECRCDKANGDPLWSARLLRREFSFVEVSGRIDRIELRCEARHFRAKFAPDVAWRVPEAWGKCSLFVFGEEGAKFRLVETAPQLAAADAAPPAP